VKALKIMESVKHCAGKSRENPYGLNSIATEKDLLQKKRRKYAQLAN